LATKPNRLVATSEPIEISGPKPRFVGRGGDKLDAALGEFGIDVTGLRCLDIGSSTGGFTDCLLQCGAAEVVAVDVGRGQLDWSLRNDSRVTVMEQTDVRDLTPAMVGEVGLVTVDVSFISLRTVLEPSASVSRRADVLALVKPQFEVGRRNVPKGGVVTDESQQLRALTDVASAAERSGFVCRGSMASPITGTHGNREFFLWLGRSR
jgi:23S rRNA (cytidine1920-2'-O)/16S rRNA (cytidine1409-2'-O)-methyltransferase